jgi:hypothetical protein
MPAPEFSHRPQGELTANLRVTGNPRRAPEADAINRHCFILRESRHSRAMCQKQSRLVHPLPKNIELNMRFSLDMVSIVLRRHND